MVKKITKYLKFVVCCALILSLIAPSYAALSASDGSAFVTKAEFDSALADFNARLTTFEAGINSKIDSQVTSYLDRNGIWNGATQTLSSPFTKTGNGFQRNWVDIGSPWAQQKPESTWEAPYYQYDIRFELGVNELVSWSGVWCDNINKSGFLRCEFKTGTYTGSEKRGFSTIDLYEMADSTHLTLSSPNFLSGSSRALGFKLYTTSDGQPYVAGENTQTTIMDYELSRNQVFPFVSYLEGYMDDKPGTWKFDVSTMTSEAPLTFYFHLLCPLSVSYGARNFYCFVSKNTRVYFDLVTSFNTTSSNFQQSYDTKAYQGRRDHRAVGALRLYNWTAEVY